MEGQFETAKLLVSLGAQLEAKDIFGNTALHFAASEGNIEAVHFLIEVLLIHFFILCLLLGQLL